MNIWTDKQAWEETLASIWRISGSNAGHGARIMMGMGSTDLVWSRHSPPGSTWHAIHSASQLLGKRPANGPDAPPPWRRGGRASRHQRAAPAHARGPPRRLATHADALATSSAHEGKNQLARRRGGPARAINSTRKIHGEGFIHFE